MDEDQLDESGPSKTQLKKLATELQELGKQLTGFKSTDLDRLPLSDRLRNAIDDYKRLPNSHGARRRQMQFIGKVMRDCDKEEIENAIEKLDSPPTQFNSKQDLSLQLCEKVLSDGDSAISEIVSNYPVLTRQKLRQLFRDSQKANETGQAKIQEKLQDYLQSAIDSKD